LHLVLALVVVGCGSAAPSVAPGVVEGTATAQPSSGLPAPRSAAPSSSQAAESSLVQARFRVGSEPLHLAVADGAVWVSNADMTVSRLDVAKGSVVTIPVPGFPGGITGDEDGIWVSMNRDAGGAPGRSVIRLDPATGAVLAESAVGEGPRGVAFAAGSAWVASGLGASVTRVTPTGETTSIPVEGQPSGIRAIDGQVWVARRTETSLVRIDPRTGDIAGTVEVGERTVWLAGTSDTLWVAGWQVPTAFRIEVTSGEVTPIDVGAPVYPGMGLLDGAAWVPAGSEIVRVDPATATVSTRIDLGASVGDIEPTAEGDGLWVLLPYTGELVLVQPAD